MVGPAGTRKVNGGGLGGKGDFNSKYQEESKKRRRQESSAGFRLSDMKLTDEWFRVHCPACQQIQNNSRCSSLHCFALRFFVLSFLVLLSLWLVLLLGPRAWPLAASQPARTQLATTTSLLPRSLHTRQALLVPHCLFDCLSHCRETKKTTSESWRCSVSFHEEGNSGGEGEKEI
jgi:hypothetical protein